MKAYFKMKTGGKNNNKSKQNKAWKIVPAVFVCFFLICGTVFSLPSLSAAETNADTVLDNNTDMSGGDGDTSVDENTDVSEGDGDTSTDTESSTDATVKDAVNAIKKSVAGTSGEEENTSASQKAATRNLLRATTGTNDTAMNAYMNTFCAPVAAGGTYSTVSGGTLTNEWKNYVNTIWKYKAMGEYGGTGGFEWVETTGIPKWSGGKASTALPTEVTDLNSWKAYMTDTTKTEDTRNNTIPYCETTTTSAEVKKVYYVYSGEQLSYAIREDASKNTKLRTLGVVLMGDIDMAGYEYNWETASLYPTNWAEFDLKSDGSNTYTIYNLGQYRTKDNPNQASGLIIGFGQMNVTNVTFDSAKIVVHKDSKASYAGVLGAVERGNGTLHGRSKLQGLTIKNSLVFSGVESSFASPIGQLSMENSSKKCMGVEMKNCSLEGNYVYGGDHVAGFSSGVSSDDENNRSSIENSYVSETMIVTYGGHSSGFVSCYADNVAIKNCFSDIDMYAATQSGGFIGLFSGTVENCFSTGKLEGFSNCGGFSASSPNGGIYGATTVKQCYSTVLTGMRSETSYAGGFHAPHFRTFGEAEGVSVYEFTDCYAAGETGDVKTDNQTTPDSGGFFSAPDTSTYTGSEAGRDGTDKAVANCYYDKQTTAMREWVAGGRKINTEAQNDGLDNVKGVLTGNTDAATGLAGGNPGTSGFTGFTDNDQWVFSEGRYPQLKVFSEAGDGWTAEQKATVKAASLTSTATITLDEWGKGYDWDDNGIRSDTMVSYHRSLPVNGHYDHKGYEYGYDTVRSIVTDAYFTSEATMTLPIRNGQGAKFNRDGEEISTESIFSIINEVHRLSVNNPGMDWVDIGCGGTERPMRFVSLMKIHSGADQFVYPGALYDHRTSLKLTAVSAIEQDKVIGLDDNDTWSSSVTSGYATKAENSDELSTAYYAAPTYNIDKLLGDTGPKSLKNSWIYTEIWTVKKRQGSEAAPPGYYWWEDPAHPEYGEYLREYQAPGTKQDDDPFVEEQAVKVTGSGTGSNTTIDERKWNGELALYPDTSTYRKYVVTYYWMTPDGRYRTDSKTVTIKPGKYSLSLHARDQEGDKSSHVLDLAATMDKKVESQPAPGADSETDYNGAHDGITESDKVLGTEAYLDDSLTKEEKEAEQEKENVINYTYNSTVSWKKQNDNIRVSKITIQFFDREGNKMGEGSYAGTVEDGTKITVPTKLFTVEDIDVAGEGRREITKIQLVSIEYYVKKDSNGIYYLKFNKLKNIIDSETDFNSLVGVSDGVPDTSSDLDANFNPTGTESSTGYLNNTIYNTQVTLQVNNYDLTLEKQVKGNYSSTDKQFEFSAAVNSINWELDYKGGSTSSSVTAPADGKLAVGSSGVSKSGINLSHRQKITVKDIPDGMTYSIKESEPGTGYVVSVKEDGTELSSSTTPAFDSTDREVTGKITKDTTILYNNTRGLVSPTGLEFLLWPFLLTLLATIAVAIAYMRNRRKNKLQISNGNGTDEGL